MISLVLIIIWMSIGMYYIFMKTSRKKSSSNIPPLADGALPIVGHCMLLLDNNSPAMFTNCVNLFLKSLYSGLNAVTLRIGTTNAYIILDPDDGYTVANTCLRKDLFYNYFRPWLGDGLFPTSNMDIWKVHRKLILPTFHQHILDGYLSESNRQARKLVKTIEKEANKGLFDHRSYIEEMAIEYICATAMGASIDDEDRQMKASYITASHLFMRGIVQRALTFWLHSDFIYSYSSLKKRQDELSSSLHSLMEAVLKKRKNKTKEIEGSDRKQYKAFLDLLLEMAEDGSLTEKEIREEVDTFIFAGSDTSASVLKYTLMAVGTYPDVQKKIQDELHEVFQDSDRDVDKEDLPKLKYIEAVIKETMRLYPVAPMIGRYLDREVHLKNYTIPAGSRCYVIMHILHRHPMWGPDALEYNPDRWLDLNTLPKNPNAFAPFGMGRRTCVGSHFAMRTLKTALSHFLRHYTVKGDISKLQVQFDVIVRPVEGYHISIDKREIQS